jgi:photosystem II stability/assembly factor-like uncharacterized protein
MMYKKTVFIVMILIASTVLHAQAWYAQTSGTTALLMDVFCTDPNTGWVVGIVNTILHTTDGGSNWVAQDPPPSVNYYSVYFTDELTGLAVGATVGGSGRIRHTTDAGSTWEIIDIASGYSLWSIFFIDDTLGWIAGGREAGFLIDPIRTIHHTTDGGYTWSTQFYQYDSLPLHDIHFTNPSTGCAVGEHGEIFWTADGGSTWDQQTSGVVQHLWGVRLLDENTAWAVGIQGIILHTTDAGATWVPQDADSSYGFGKVMFTDANDGWISGGDNDTGIILRTTDGGSTWSTQNTGATTTMMSVHFTDADTGWAVGNLGTIMHTTTGGTGIAEKETFNTVQADLRTIHNAPNPFSNSTTIQFTLSLNCNIYLSVYNATGQKIAVLLDEPLPAGEHSVTFDGKDLPAGVYLYRLQTGDMTQIRRCILVK